MGKGRYAENTTVSAERSRIEIETVLKRYGADELVSGWTKQSAMIGFRVHNRLVKFILPMPILDETKYTETGRVRNDSSWEKTHEQEIKRRWRALLLNIKSKLEAVETGITTFDEEFLPHIVMQDGKTVGEHVIPRIAEAYETGSVPSLLPSGMFDDDDSSEVIVEGDIIE